MFGNLIDWVGEAVEYVAVRMPIVGPAIVAGLESAEVVTSGGGVTVETSEGTTTRYGSAASPVLSTVKSTTIFGVPVLFILGGGLLALILFRKKGG